MLKIYRKTPLEQFSLHLTWNAQWLDLYDNGLKYVVMGSAVPWISNKS